MAPKDIVGGVSLKVKTLAVAGAVMLAQGRQGRPCLAGPLSGQSRAAKQCMSLSLEGLQLREPCLCHQSFVNQQHHLEARMKVWG